MNVITKLWFNQKKKNVAHFTPNSTFLCIIFHFKQSQTFFFLSPFLFLILYLPSLSFSRFLSIRNRLRNTVVNMRYNISYVNLFDLVIHNENSFICHHEIELKCDPYFIILFILKCHFSPKRIILLIWIQRLCSVKSS